MKLSTCTLISGLLISGALAADPQDANSNSGSGSGSNQDAQAASQTTGSSGSASSSSSAKTDLEYDVVAFENLGYSSYYYNVKELTDPDTDDCSCTLSTSKTTFSGTNAPLNQELSVHFRGPLILSKFAYYTADNYVLDDDTSANWTRAAYYEASAQSSENVTFLTHAGTNSSCLGVAITYAGSDGVSEASDATLLAEDTLINSDEEFIIMSNVTCDDSDYDNDCGVYRDGIPAFHGFYGDTKMFLFEFQMPTEDELSKDEVAEYYDMPAIWLLNAHIPRTAQYPTNTNCSCWESGCGEFDIFEVLNSSETTHLYSTIHDYQGTGDIADGLQPYGYISRDTSATMRGGVVFDSNGTASVFMTNDTYFDEVVAGADLHSWISDAGDEVTDTLLSVASSSSTSSSSGDIVGLSYRSLLAAVFLNLFMFLV